MDKRILLGKSPSTRSGSLNHERTNEMRATTPPASSRMVEPICLVEPRSNKATLSAASKGMNVTAGMEGNGLPGCCGWHSTHTLGRRHWDRNRMDELRFCGYGGPFLLSCIIWRAGWSETTVSTYRDETICAIIKTSKG
jgi:hypothetical protein